MTRYRWVRGVWILTVLALLFIGCMGPATKRQSPGEFEKDIKSAIFQERTITEEGALWSPRSAHSFYSDIKARNVGDIVTISIVESATASKNAKTQTGRDSGLKAGWNGIFEMITKGWKFHKQPIGASHQIDFSNNFDGKGETTRSSSMVAYITVRVIHVLPNGNLVIQGSRQVQVNNESQHIYIRGVIRPEDISSTNVILSTYVADAVIELSGEGAISDKQNPGWLAQVLDWVWPF